jgi:sulfite reductase (NADPH) hemoprotein beta-component
VHAHQIEGYRAVTLSLKRANLPPGDVTTAQMEAAATMSDRYSLGELRVSHDQNLILPWVREADLRAVWHAAQEAGFATPNIGLLTDMIACPGGDLCALANARSLPIAAAITEQFDDLDALLDLGDIDLHISGCMNSCGHHHPATSASWASTRTGPSGTRSASAAPTAARSAAPQCRPR